MNKNDRKCQTPHHFNPATPEHEQNHQQKLIWNQKINKTIQTKSNVTPKDENIIAKTLNRFESMESMDIENDDIIASLKSVDIYIYIYI